MTEKKLSREKPDPAKIAALKSLPKEVMETLTGDEVRVFLKDDIWPDSLREKLKGYMVGDG